MKKVLLLLGLLFAVEGKQFFAARKKVAPKKDDKVTEFFGVISNSFVLKEGQEINGDTFGHAVWEVRTKIIDHVPETTKQEIWQYEYESRRYRDMSDWLDDWISNNDLLQKIAAGEQKKLDGITQDALLVEKANSLPPLIYVLFYMTSMKDDRGKYSRALLTKLFESEAKGDTTIFQEAWNVKKFARETFFYDLFGFSYDTKQEAFFFPLFAELIKRGVVNLSEQKHGYGKEKFSFYSRVVDQYKELFNEESRTLASRANAYAAFLDTMEPDISEDLLLGLFYGMEKHDYESEKPLSLIQARQQAMKELYKKIIQKQVKKYEVTAVKTSIIYLLNQYEPDPALVNACFELLDSFVQAVNSLPSNQEKCTSMLHDILRAYIFAYANDMKENTTFLSKINAIIGALRDKDAAINYHKKEDEEGGTHENCHTVLYDAVYNNAPLKFVQILINNEAQLSLEEKTEDNKKWFQDMVKNRRIDYNVDAFF